jgi:hypothetical protein
MKPNAPFEPRYAVNADTGCWEWTGAVGSHSYGVMSVRSRMMRAHRLSWEHHFGPIPPGAFVMHRTARCEMQFVKATMHRDIPVDHPTSCPSCGPLPLAG